MLEFAAVLVSFAVIPLLKKTRQGIGVKLLATALVMALLNRISPLKMWEIFKGVFVNSNSRDTILVVAMVSVIGALMKEYKVLDKVVESLSSLISNVKVLFIVLPALVGTLTIPGGAILSAPFIDSMGERVNLPSPKRAAVNLVFRHIAMFILPYSSSLLVVSAMLPQYSKASIIGVNTVFTIPLIAAGYFLYLRKIPKGAGEQAEKRPLGQSLKNVIIYASPIYACLIVNMVTGLPLFLCMFVSLGILYFMGPKKGFIKLAASSISYSTMLAIVGVFMIEGIVKNLSGLTGLFEAMFNTGTFTLPALILGSLFFGMITGFHMMPMGIVFPMLLGLSLSKGELLAYVYFVYCWSFLGYYFSPLHMCQIFTCEYMGVKPGALFKEYAPLIAFICLYLTGSFFVLRAVLPMIMG
jgi:integral membrane protein (TIGR00529 family)